MSHRYEICKGGLDEETSDLVDVAEFIRALAEYPPFAKKGYAWPNQDWADDPCWRGVTFYIQNHAPGLDADDSFNYETGGAGSILVVCPYYDDVDFDDVFDLVVYLAKRLEAHAWDHGSGEDLLDDLEEN